MWSFRLQMKRKGKGLKNESLFFSLMLTSAIVIIGSLWMLIDLDNLVRIYRLSDEEVDQSIKGSIVMACIFLPVFIIAVSKYCKIIKQKKNARQTIRVNGLKNVSDNV